MPKLKKVAKVIFVGTVKMCPGPDKAYAFSDENVVATRAFIPIQSQPLTVTLLSL